LPGFLSLYSFLFRISFYVFNWYISLAAAAVVVVMGLRKAVMATLPIFQFSTRVDCR